MKNFTEMSRHGCWGWSSHDITKYLCQLFPAGGAQDVKNFRENVKSGYLPLPSDVSFEGICKDYYFSMEPTDR